MSLKQSITYLKILPNVIILMIFNLQDALLIISDIINLFYCMGWVLPDEVRGFN